MISTRGRYALRVMLDLAEQDSDKYIPLEEIANRQEISKKYLEIILKVLVDNKLLRGMRGKGGGYKLTKPPEDYNVGEILELTERNFSMVSCPVCIGQSCPRQDECKTLSLWTEFNRVTREFFYGKKLTDLLGNFSHDDSQ